VQLCKIDYIALLNHPLNLDLPFALKCFLISRKASPKKWFPENEFWIRDLLAAIIDGAYHLTCTVDGESIAADFRGMKLGSSLRLTFRFWFDTQEPCRVH
jgi:hypothetical protein